MDTFIRHLSPRLRGSCSTDPAVLSRHSGDMGIYSIQPRAVVTPAHPDDLAILLKTCSDEGVAVTPRAGASNTGGAAVGSGVIVLPLPVDLPDGEAAPSDEETPITVTDQTDEAVTVSVPAGLRHDRLQRWLRDRGYHLPSDPSSGPLSFIGANVATRASGAHALQDGAIDRYLVSLRALPADGTRIDTARPQTVPARILHGLAAIATELRQDAQSIERIGTKRSLKSASGYNLAPLATTPDDAWDPTPVLNALFAGSVGTLGVIERVTLRCPRAPKGETLAVLAFRSELHACAAVQAVRETDPSACEILNSFCTRLLAEQGVGWAADADAVLVVEYAGDGHHDRAALLQSLLRSSEGLTDFMLVQDRDGQAHFWKLRKQMMLRLRNRSDHRAALSVVNDVGVPVSALGPLLDGAASIFSRREIPLPVYGHAADGNLHLRPLYDTADPRLGSIIAETAAETYRLVLDLGGTISAEHGMGRLRAPFLRLEWGDTIYRTMKDVKRLFDPAGILNTEAMFYEGPLLRHTPWDDHAFKAHN